MTRRLDAGWLANRLPHIPQRSAYQAIEIYKGVDEQMFASLANTKPGIVAEIAKAEPDVQALCGADEGR